MPHHALWLTQPDTMFAEVAFACGVRRLVIDIEHGAFPLHQLFGFLAFTRAAGAHVLAKVSSATPEAIQQAIDLGVDGVVIPHVLGVDHARLLCQTAKFPPLGTRSYAGGRTVRYLPPLPDYLATENQRVMCYPMVETPEALADVEAILALDCVDGIFPGPTDLAISMGRGLYRFEANRAELTRCAQAANAAGKHWVMPAWTAAERAFAAEHQAHEIVVATQTMLLRQGVQQVQQTLATEGLIA